MRIPSGKTDQSIFFVAVDATDLKTRETGLSGFTVYRSRNGGAAVAYTTPTVTEVSAANMPGVYALLIDEDTTIAAGSDSEEYTVHISQAAMSPVTRAVELYRRDTTSGRTLDVSAGGEAGLDWANIGSPTTPQNLSATNFDVDQVVASVTGAVGSVTGLTPATVHADLDDIQTRLPSTLVSGRMDVSVGAVATNAITAASINSAALNGKGDWNIGKTGYALSPAGIQAIWDALTSALTTAGSIGKLFVDNINATISSRSTYAGADTSGTTTLLTRIIGTLAAGTHNPQSGDAFARLGVPAGASVSADIAAVKSDSTAIKAKTDNLPASPAATTDCITASGVRTAVGLAAANLDTQLTTIDDFLDTEISAIKAKTDQFNFTIAGQVDANALSGGGGLNAAGIRSAIGLATANLDTQLTTIDDFLDTEVLAIKAKTDNLPASPAATTDCITASGVRTAIGLATANLDTQLDALPTNAELTTALGTSDDATLSAIAALNNVSTAQVQTAAAAALTAYDPPTRAETVSDALAIISEVNANETKIDTLQTSLDSVPSADENADALLKRDWTAVTGEASRSVLNAMRFIRNKFSTTITPGSVTIYKEDDTSVAYTKTLTTSASADPIVEG